MIRKLLWPRYIGLINQWKKSSAIEKRLISTFGVFGLLFWCGLFALFWWGISTMYSVEIGGPFILRKLLDILMLSLFGLLCFSSTVTALSSFYLSDDLELLLSLPISRAHFFFGRLIDTLIQSAWMPVSLALPILISYGIVYGSGLDILSAHAFLFADVCTNPMCHRHYHCQPLGFCVSSEKNP